MESKIHGNTKFFDLTNIVISVTVDKYVDDLWRTVKENSLSPTSTQREMLGAILLYYINFAPEMALYRRTKEENNRGENK